jgi:hypothetical protein
VTESGAMIVERVTRFLTEPQSASFEELALAAFAFQYERIEPFRRLCQGRGLSPESVTDWRQVPPVPTAAFKSDLPLATGPAAEVFRSSGTTEGSEARSVHHHPFPELYRQTIDASFPGYCLPAAPPVAMLSLIPTRDELPDSSLSFMVDHVIARFGDPAKSLVGLGKRGVEVMPARSWAGARQREGRPVLVLATALALAQWLDALKRQDLRFRLPPGSAVFETGGFKGRETELTREGLTEGVAERLGMPAQGIVREYGMTELTSQCYTRSLLGEDPDRFVAPHWVRVRVLDPETLEEAPAGTPGLLSIFDLANLGSAVHLLTEDLGVSDGDGFRLLGRAAGAELRGCSLVAEELARR